jgi:polyferredoxin
MNASPQPEAPAPRPSAPARPAPTLDSVTTINADGSHYFLHPADARGRFLFWRRLSGYALIVIYFVLPWVPVNGSPAVFLDLARRRFHLFGWTLAAQDLWLLFFLVTGLGFSLFFITALLGRLWCGWACPQTVFLEHVYRRIERWIDGDAASRRALDRAPWTTGKTLRRVAKHVLYILVSLAITHLFLAYFVSLPELWSFMRAAPGEHWTAFAFVFVAAGVLYFNFAWFREQLCIVICPYGRLQSALTDDHSLVIGYDARRGEPRGKLRTEDRSQKSEDRSQRSEVRGQRTEDRGQGWEQTGTAAAPALAVPSAFSALSSAAPAGDCVACNRCVQVCPTGIDIRQGLQLECIGCAACIDACDEVMTRIKRPTGLIRYDSLAGLTGQRTRWIRPRTVVYGLLLLVGAAVATFAFSTVKPANFTVFRMGGAAYFVDRDTVRNQFLVRVLNKRVDTAEFTLALEDAPAGVTRTGFAAPIAVPAMGEEIAPLVLVVDRGHYRGPFHFTVRVRDASGDFNAARQVEFLGPDPALLAEEDRARGIRR